MAPPPSLLHTLQMMAALVLGRFAARTLPNLTGGHEDLNLRWTLNVKVLLSRRRATRFSGRCQVLLTSKPMDQDLLNPDQGVTKDSEHKPGTSLEGLKVLLKVPHLRPPPTFRLASVLCPR